MPTPTRGLPRLLRAAVVATVCTGVSVGGHMAGGGERPRWGALALVAAVVAAGAVLGSARRWTAGRLLVILGAAQTGCHLVFAHAPAAGDTAAHAGAHTGQSHPLLMFTAHALAAAALAWLLARGDALLWRLLDLLAGLAATLGRRLTPAEPTGLPEQQRDCPAVDVLPAPQALRFLPSAPRRGPPRAVLPG